MKLTSQFKSRNGILYSVEISSRAIAQNDTFTLAENPAVLRYDRGDTKYATTKSVLCTINVVTDQDWSYLYSDTPFDCSVVINDLTNNTTIFVGYMIPSQWNTDARPGMNRITLNAVDVIGMLKYKDMDNSWRIISTPQAIWETIFTELNFNEDEMTNTYNGNSKVNVDALLPADHTESISEGNWPTYIDAINAINRYTNTLTMVWGGQPINANIDTYLQNTWWQSSPDIDASGMIKSDSLSVEIDPAYSKIEYIPDGGEKLYINDIFGGIDVDHIDSNISLSLHVEQEERTFIFRWASLTEQARVKDFLLEPISSNYETRSNILFYGDYRDGDPVADSFTPVIWNKLTLIPAAKHTVFQGQNLFIEAKIYIGGQGDIYPTYWQVSQRESDTQEPDESGGIDQVRTAHIALKVNGKIIYPQYVDNSNYKDDVPGFYSVRYNFFDLPGGSVEVVFINTSDASVFITDIYALGSYNYRSVFFGSYSVLDSLHDSFKRALSIRMPFMGDDGISRDFNAYTEGDDNRVLMAETRRLFSQQYQRSRRIFTATLDLSGFHPWAKVRWHGHKCTIDAAEIDLRNDNVTAKLLESWDQ